MADFIKSLGLTNLDSTWSVAFFVLDCLIVFYIIYKIITTVRETRAWQLLKGVIIILIAAKFTDVIGLKWTSYLLNSAVSYMAIAFFVLFQPELRRALEQIGHSKFRGFLGFFDIRKGDKVLQKSFMIDEIVKAVSNLSSRSTGAIIIYERETKLGEIINTGTKLDACVSSELLENLFVPNTPLHDGAVVIRDVRIIAAGCFLGLTDNQNLSKSFGTRHRAAMGITEISDCLAITVSEETSKISFYINGEIYHNVSIDTLKQYLIKTIIEDDSYNLNLKEKHSIINSFKHGKKMSKL